MTTIERGGELIRRPPLLAVDVRGALHVVGVLIAYLSLSILVPTAFALGYSESPWPFLVAGAIVGAAGVATARLTRGEHRLGIREGFLVVSLTWLVAAVLGALPFLLSGNPQLDRPVDAYFEGMSGFSTTGGSLVTDVEALPRSLADLAPADAVVRRHRDHRAGAGGAAPPPRRRPPAARARDAGPGDRDAEHAHPRNGAARVGALRRPHRHALRDPAGDRGQRGRRGDDAVPGVRALPDDDPDRRLFDEEPLARGLQPRSRSGSWSSS